MLNGKAIVVVKTGKDTPPITEEYQRAYLEYASTDELETYSKTSDGSDLMVNGVKWSGTRPKNSVTSLTSDQIGQMLVPEALAYFQANFPEKDSNGSTIDPWFVLLKAASHGANMWVYNSLAAKNRPSKPVSEDAGVAKMAKTLLSMGKVKTLEEGLVKARTLLG